MNFFLITSMDRFKITKSEKPYYESTDDDDGEGKTVTSSLLEMKELNGPRYEGRIFVFNCECRGSGAF